MLESGACSLTIYSCALTDAPTHCHPFVKSCLNIYVLLKVLELLSYYKLCISCFIFLGYFICKIYMFLVLCLRVV